MNLLKQVKLDKLKISSFKDDREKIDFVLNLNGDNKSTLILINDCFQDLKAILSEANIMNSKQVSICQKIKCFFKNKLFWTHTYFKAKLYANYKCEKYSLTLEKNLIVDG